MNIAVVLIAEILAVAISIKAMFFARDERANTKAITSGESSTNNMQGTNNNARVKPPVAENSPIKGIAGGLINKAPKVLGIAGKAGGLAGKVGAGLIGGGLMAVGTAAGVVEAGYKQTGLGEKIKNTKREISRAVTTTGAKWKRKGWERLSDTQREKIYKAKVTLNNAKEKIGETRDGIRQAGRKVGDGINRVGNHFKEISDDAHDTIQQYKDAWGEMRNGISNSVKSTKSYQLAKMGENLIAHTARNHRGGTVRVTSPSSLHFGRLRRVDTNYETVGNEPNNRVNIATQQPELLHISENHINDPKNDLSNSQTITTVDHAEERRRKRLEEAVKILKERGDKPIGSTFSKSYANAALNIENDSTLTPNAKNHKLDVLRSVSQYAPTNVSTEKLMGATNSVYGNVNKSVAQIDMENLRKAQAAAEKKNDTRALIEAEIFTSKGKPQDYSESMRKYVESFGMKFSDSKGKNPAETKAMMDQIYDTIAKPGGFQSEEAKAVFGEDVKKMQAKIEQKKQENINAELTNIVNSQIGDIIKNTGASLTEARDQYYKDQFKKALDTEMKKFAEANRPGNIISEANRPTNPATQVEQRRVTNSVVRPETKNVTQTNIAMSTGNGNGNGNGNEFETKANEISKSGRKKAS